MDAYEATRIVFSRIQNLDPENASKIMGLLLIQDHGEKEMIRLAFGPEALVHSVVLKARKDMGLSSNTPSTPSTPSSPSPFSNSFSISRQNSSSRMLGGSGLGLTLPPSLTIPSPSISPPSSSWAPSIYSDLHNPDDLISSNSTSSACFAPVNGMNNMAISSSSSLPITAASSSPFYANDLVDDFHLRDQFSFLNDASPTLGSKNTDLFYAQQEPALSPSGSGDAMLYSSYGAANWGASMNGGNPHRRSCSVTDISLSSDEAGSGFGWKPCLYFARGYCKNGASCRFLHSGLPDSAAMAETTSVVGSPNKLDIVEQCQELLRSKSTQQQRLAAASQLMASSSFPYNAAAASKCMNFLLQQQQNDTQRTASSLMMSEDLHKFGRSRLERSDFSSPGGGGMVNPGSRQIYLTFPADSTFREEDVSNYFSIYGPVQDVRIPYQQKRMFGFVTFVYPETVKLILAKGNPHFVCDARVLVKPYKEKGKVPDKYRKQQQQAERGEFSACTTPTGLDSRDPFDLQLGARMLYNTQDMLLRRKLEEQADLQHAIELQSRRLMNLQLLDVKKHHQRNLSSGSAIPSPTYSHPVINQSLSFSSDRSSLEVPEENCKSSTTVISSNSAADNDKQLQQAVNVAQEPTGKDNNGSGKEENNSHGHGDFQESVDHNLPDSPFASPTRSTGEHLSIFSGTSCDADRCITISATSSSSTNNSLISPPLLPATSTLDMASLKACFFPIPRFPSGHGAIGM